MTIARRKAGTPRTAKPAARPRDRARTEGEIVAAAARLAARDGFGALGVNSLAAEAGYDKKLIARYFGGLDGVVAALGREVDLWLGRADPPAPAGDYAGMVRGMLAAYGAALRADRLLQGLLAWELVAPSPALRRMNASRSRAMQAWFARARGTIEAPPGVDAPATNAVLLAALHHLALRERTLGDFAGLPLKTAADWARVEAALDALLRAAYGVPETPPRKRR
jgi:AcrR family transcriptional regulator